MTRIRRTAAALVIVWAVLCPPAGGAEATLPKPSDAWIEVRTENFRFFSNAGRLNTRRVAVDLEELRATLSELTDYELQSPLPTYIYVFKSERSFLPYKILYEDRPATLSGYFIASEEGNYIAINADSPDASAVVYHEYVHYIANNNLWYLPVWVSEGLAEFYESFEVSGNTVYIGLPALRHLRLLRGSIPIPLEELILVDRDSQLYNEGERKGALYAESWALVHYLMLGSEDRRRQLGRYLDLVRDGAPGNAAFAAAFGDDLETLEFELRTYLRSLRLPWIETTVEIDIDKNFRISKMPRSDVLFRLGDLLANHRPERPERRIYFEAAIEADPGHGPSLSALAVEAEESADWRTAIDLHQRAVAASPDDPMVLYHWGRFLSRRGGEHESAVSVLTRSTELDPSFAPSWALLANVYADAGDTSDEAVAAARTAHTMRPSDVMAARDLVRLYLRLDRRQEAVTLIEQGLRSHRRVQAQAWMLVIQQDLFRARQLLQDGDAAAAMQRLDLTERIADRSMDPVAAHHNIEATRHSIIEHEAAALFNQAQERYSQDDREGARALLEQALTMVDDGPVASSSRQLLALMDRPQAVAATPVSSVTPSPTASEIDHYNHLVAARDFEAALAYLEGMRSRVSAESRQWLEDRIREVRRTVDYNRYVDEYNRAVDHYNRKEYGEAVRVLEALLDVLPEGREAESAQALLDDARAAIRP